MARSNPRTRVRRLTQWLEADVQVLVEEREFVRRLENRIRGVVQLLAVLDVEGAELRALLSDDVWTVVVGASEGAGRRRSPSHGRLRSGLPHDNLPASPVGVGQEAASSRRRDVLDAVIEATRRGTGQLTLGEVVMHLRARGFGVHDRTIRRDLDRLVSEGLLSHPERGVFALAPSGVGPLVEGR